MSASEFRSQRRAIAAVARERPAPFAWCRYCDALVPVAFSPDPRDARPLCSNCGRVTA